MFWGRTAQHYFPYDLNVCAEVQFRRLQFARAGCAGQESGVQGKLPWLFFRFLAGAPIRTGVRRQRVAGVVLRSMTAKNEPS